MNNQKGLKCQNNIRFSHNKTKDYEIEEYDSNDDDDDYEPLIDRLVEEFGDLTAETADSKKKAKIVPLFGDGNDKLQ